MKALSTGELARQAGVGVETVRFYERQGLLAEPDRRASGYRQYDDEEVGLASWHVHLRNTEPQEKQADGPRDIG